ncbi:hypothetical protein [Massilia sp. CT11-137]|uniref:hypothetical protein n=1 Tax=Massilia sp. CT11-137 TaxID=3393901 RepID=UPI0039AF0BFC
MSFILVYPKIFFGPTTSVIGLLAIIAVSIGVRNWTDRFWPGNDNLDSSHELSSIFFRENSAPFVHTVWGDKKR